MNQVRLPTVTSYTAQAEAAPGIPAGITTRRGIPGCTEVFRGGTMIGWVYQDRSGIRAYRRICDPAVATGVPLGPARTVEAAVARIAEAVPEASAPATTRDQQ